MRSLGVLIFLWLWCVGFLGCTLFTPSPCEDAETRAFLDAVRATTEEHAAYTKSDAVLDPMTREIRLARDAEILERIQLVTTRRVIAEPPK